MNLSDAFKTFENGEKAVNLELKVKVYNINMKENHPILLKCLALFAYTKFNDYVKIGERKGRTGA